MVLGDKNQSTIKHTLITKSIAGCLFYVYPWSFKLEKCQYFLVEKKHLNWSNGVAPDQTPCSDYQAPDTDWHKY